MSYSDENHVALGRALIRSMVWRMLHLAPIAGAVAALGVACGTAANPPPIATVSPTGTAAPAPTVAPLATVATAAAVARGQAPASVFVIPTPRPTRTPMPRVEGDMTQPVLYGHTGTLLEDGRVLVAGGQVGGQSEGFLSDGLISAEIFDPSTGRWSRTGSMLEPHRFHGAVLLVDGRVLVSGGISGEFERSPASADVTGVGTTASAEVYNPSTETWSIVGDMPGEMGAHSLELLENGKVLALGGIEHSVGLYDPSSGTWASAGASATSRESYPSALLGNGKVLLVGGWDGSALMDSVELYDPLTGSSSSTGSLMAPRVASTAAVLADGRVLVSGGHATADGSTGLVASAEIYDPSSGSWSVTVEMATKRVRHTATLLSDGRVLVVGGSPNRTTEIYDPSTGSWSRTARTIEHREWHTVTLLNDGRVLVAGGASGISGREFLIASAEVYDPATYTWAPSTEAAR